MTAKIYSLSDESYLSLLLTDTEIYLSNEALSSEAAFERVRMGSAVQGLVIPLTAITKIEYTTDTVSAEVHYVDNGEADVEEINFELGQNSLFAQDVANRLTLRHTEEEEGFVAAILPGLIFLVVAAGLFALALSLDDEDVLGRRGNRRVAILRLIWGILGQTGVLLVLGLAIAFALYLIFDNVFNRAIIHTYSKNG